MAGRRAVIKGGVGLFGSWMLLEFPLMLTRLPTLLEPVASPHLHGALFMETTKLPQRPSMSTEAAVRAVAAAVAESTKMSVPVTVVVLDESGALKELRRMDGAPLVSVQTAINKAYAALAIGMPTDDFYHAIQMDAAAVASFATRPGLALIAGGIPVIVDGSVAAGIGVAGALTGAEDRRVAEEAARAALG